MGDVRVGVVGVNGIGQAHLFAVPSIDGLTLAAACDVDAARAAKAAADHGVEAFDDAERLFTSGDVDAVVIATPPGTHGALVRRAVAAGLHVYCEKPFVPTCDEGYELGRTAAAAGVVLQVGLQYRFHKGYAAARRLVADGGLGEVFRADLTATNWFRTQHYFEVSPWRATWRMAGGGVLISHAVHQVDALLSMTGLPSRLTARVYRARHRAEVEDEAVVLMEWSSGARGVVVASLNDPVGTDLLELHGELGALAVEGYEVRRAVHETAQRLNDEVAEEFPELQIPWQPVEVERKPSEWFDMILDSHREFAAAIREGRPSVADAAEGTRSIEFANAAYLSALRGETVSLPLDAGDYPRLYEQLCRGELAVPTTPGAAA